MPQALSIAVLSIASGGRLGLCGLPGLLGPLSPDIQTIVEWAPAHVVSMTGQAEMDAAGSGDLGALIKDCGIEWTHLPVHDFGGLSSRDQQIWPALSARLHECLDAGAGILVHCRGGRGRSGMIILKLLVERGEPAHTALARLREVRPGAVETDEQLTWASLG